MCRWQLKVETARENEWCEQDAETKRTKWMRWKSRSIAALHEPDPRINPHSITGHGVCRRVKMRGRFNLPYNEIQRQKNVKPAPEKNRNSRECQPTQMKILNLSVIFNNSQSNCQIYEIHVSSGFVWFTV